MGILMRLLGSILEYLIKPYGYAVIAEKQQGSMVSPPNRLEHGVDVELVLNEVICIVADIPNDGFVIAHNMDHEHGP